MQTPYKNDLVFFGLEYFVYHKKTRAASS